MKTTVLHQLLALSFCIMIAVACSPGNGGQPDSPAITSHDLQTHVTLLNSGDTAYRQTATAGEARTAAYIGNRFEEYGLLPAGDEQTYFQEYVYTDARSGEKRISRNVIGLAKGTDEAERFITLTVRYTTNKSRPETGNGVESSSSPAASAAGAVGIAGLLELAQHFGNRPTSRSILFIAFSGSDTASSGAGHYINTKEQTARPGQTIAALHLSPGIRHQEAGFRAFPSADTGRWKELLRNASSGSDAILMADQPPAGDSYRFFEKHRIPSLYIIGGNNDQLLRKGDNDKAEAMLNMIRRLVLSIDAMEGEPFAQD